MQETLDNLETQTGDQLKVKKKNRDMILVALFGRTVIACKFYGI